MITLYIILGFSAVSGILYWLLQRANKKVAGLEIELNQTKISLENLKAQATVTKKYTKKQQTIQQEAETDAEKDVKDLVNDVNSMSGSK